MCLNDFFARLIFVLKASGNLQRMEHCYGNVERNTVLLKEPKKNKLYVSFGVTCNKIIDMICAPSAKLLEASRNRQNTLTKEEDPLIHKKWEILLQHKVNF